MDVTGEFAICPLAPALEMHIDAALATVRHRGADGAVGAMAAVVSGDAGSCPQLRAPLTKPQLNGGCVLVATQLQRLSLKRASAR
jgi:hypothetical protein